MGTDGQYWGLCHLWGPAPHLLLPGHGPAPRPSGQLLAVLQGGQQPHGPPLGLSRLLLVLDTQAALGILVVPAG